MRIFVVCCFLVSASCTKHNPAVCCNTPTQCSSFGLDGVIGCDTGKVCDTSGACVNPQCASSAECADPDAYCSTDGLCVAACVADTECPGGGQGSDQIHCYMGGCVQCGTAADCSGTSPICSSSQACVACKLDADCPSQACNTDGSCVDASMIAYVSTTGTDTADCSQATPCSLTHGIAIGRPYTVIGTGTYQLAAQLTITGTRAVLGVNKPTITRTTPGAILNIGTASNVLLSNLIITGATNTTTQAFDGVGILCVNDQASRTLKLTDVTITANAALGVDGESCGVTALRTEFSHNGGDGLLVKDNPASLDRCNFNRNGFEGLEFDGTLLTVTNSFFTDNVQMGALISSGVSGGTLQFSTFAENKAGFEVGAPTGFDASNNLIAGNTNPVQCTGCTTSGSITLTDETTAHFKTPSFDFHITAGSVAIDAASGSTLDHDFDGDKRPLGNGRDVGADEAQ